MKTCLLLFPLVLFLSCQEHEQQSSDSDNSSQRNNASLKTYREIKNDIEEKRKSYSKITALPDTAKIFTEIRDFWIKMICEDLYEKWKGTPWDFNGTTEIPGQGKIACGYFVTTILKDMDLKINRVKLSTCPSLEMMKSLSSNQKIINASYMDYSKFNDYIKRNGKAVYIIGLDFHTGIIVNDGTENWFIHSNYINKQGVIKESVLNSAALMHSKTRWMTSLTGNKSFIAEWLKAN